MKKKISEKRANRELEKKMDDAKELLENKDDMEEFLQKLEVKIKKIPKAGDTLAIVPTLISLVRSYVKKEYDKMPAYTVIAIVGALIYFLTPADLIPDFIFGLGFIDDVGVITACLKLVDRDVKNYQEWREKNNKIINN